MFAHRFSNETDVPEKIQKELRKLSLNDIEALVV
jgi:hypothetical protein